MLAFVFDIKPVKMAEKTARHAFCLAYIKFFV